MLQIEIPGRDTLRIEHVVLDYNGTIAVDGALLAGVRARIEALLPLVDIHVLTADTYGTVKVQCAPLGVHVKTFPQAGAAACKRAIVEKLGDGVCAIGNGFNDIGMFDQAALSIAVLEGEGLCAALLPHAHMLVRSAEEGLDLLLKPGRLCASLRS